MTDTTETTAPSEEQLKVEEQAHKAKLNASLNALYDIYDRFKPIVDAFPDVPAKSMMQVALRYLESQTIPPYDAQLLEPRSVGAIGGTFILLSERSFAMSLSMSIIEQKLTAEDLQPFFEWLHAFQSFRNTLVCTAYNTNSIPVRDTLLPEDLAPISLWMAEQLPTAEDAVQPELNILVKFTQSTLDRLGEICDRMNENVDELELDDLLYLQQTLNNLPRKID